jgi:hypothetical protein
MLYFSPDGEELGRALGYKSADELLAWLVETAGPR